MDMQILTTFFMWCTIINGSLFIVWASFIFAKPDWVYASQTRWVTISRESFNVVMYSFLGLFKVLFLMLNLVPYLVLEWLY
ncbi:hypothetical protein A9Q78_00295 [Methylophaga sp. 41_12_T18]|nr:hypothetical protein A9Q78_00295 [Methylophaga sp. 41_12_T18]